MKNVVLRPPRDADWQAVLALANRSVAGVPGAGAQDAWLANRRAFDPAAGLQRQWVAEEPEGDEIVGYVAFESRASGASTPFRLFVVTEPAQRATVGQELLNHALAELRKLGAGQAQFIEFAEDVAFVAFLQRHGFNETGRLALDGGALAVVLSKSLDSSDAAGTTG